MLFRSAPPGVDSFGSGVEDDWADLLDCSEAHGATQDGGDASVKLRWGLVAREEQRERERGKSTGREGEAREDLILHPDGATTSALGRSTRELRIGRHGLESLQRWRKTTGRNSR